MRRLYEIRPGLYIGGTPSPDALRAADVDALLTVCTKHPGPAADVVDRFQHLPIPDGKVVAVDRYRHGADVVDRWLSSGARVAVNCLAGRNRSAAVAALVLIDRDGLSAADAIARIIEIRGDVALHNPATRRWIESLP